MAVIGSTGQLGSDLAQQLSVSKRYEVTRLSHHQVDVADRDSVRRFLFPGRFDVVINCAALTHVDACEERPGEAFQVNAVGALEVARACAESQALCVFVSTDFVFGGGKGEPYSEADPPSPVNVYGTSKLAGEILVGQACRRWLTVRVASLFGRAGSRGKGGNFVETILAKARAGGPVHVVNDIWMSPSYTVDVAGMMAGLIEGGAVGLYHGANQGRCTWFEFAQEAVRAAGLDAEIQPIPSDRYPMKAKRPKDSSMRSLRLESVLGYPMRSWQEALKAYLIERGHLQE